MNSVKFSSKEGFKIFFSITGNTSINHDNFFTLCAKYLRLILNQLKGNTHFDT